MWLWLHGEARTGSGHLVEKPVCRVLSKYAGLRQDPILPEDRLRDFNCGIKRVMRSDAHLMHDEKRRKRHIWMFGIESDSLAVIGREVGLIGVVEKDEFLVLWDC